MNNLYIHLLIMKIIHLVYTFIHTYKRNYWNVMCNLYSTLELEPTFLHNYNLLPFLPVVDP